LSTGFYRETIPQERTSWSKSTLLRCGRAWKCATCIEHLFPIHSYSIQVFT